MYNIKIIPPDLIAINGGNTGNPIGIRYTNQDIAAIVSNINLLESVFSSAFASGTSAIRLSGAVWSVQPDPGNASNILYECTEGAIFLNGRIYTLSAQSLSIPNILSTTIPLLIPKSIPDSGEPHTLTDGQTTHVVRTILKLDCIADEPANVPTAIPYNEVSEVLQGKWQPLTLLNGWVASGLIEYKKIGKQVFLRGNLHQTSTPTSEVFANLPASVRPPSGVTQICFGRYLNGITLPPDEYFDDCATVYIDVNGDILVQKQFWNTSLGVGTFAKYAVLNFSYWLD